MEKIVCKFGGSSITEESDVDIYIASVDGDKITETQKVHIGGKYSYDSVSLPFSISDTCPQSDYTIVAKGLGTEAKQDVEIKGCTKEEVVVETVENETNTTETNTTVDFTQNETTGTNETNTTEQTTTAEKRGTWFLTGLFTKTTTNSIETQEIVDGFWPKMKLFVLNFI